MGDMPGLTGPIYRPGEVVPRSGQYGSCDRYGTYQGREVTCVRGERFPPTRAGTAEYGYRLRDLTVHSR
jgi:hypothetical protein